MARLVKRFRDKPYELAVGGETLYICGCGLSANLPFCDGTHKSARGEEADRLHWYDEEGKRHLAADGYSGIRDDKETQDA
jgi:CDGSH-type Zn-finger protein